MRGGALFNSEEAGGFKLFTGVESPRLVLVTSAIELGCGLCQITLQAGFV